MDIQKDNKKTVVIIIIVVGILLFLLIFSNFIFGDNKKMPVDSEIGEKRNLNGIDYQITNPKYDETKGIVEFDFEFFIDEFNANNYNLGYKREHNIYYADPKQKIENPTIKYETNLEEYKPREDEVAQKIVIRVQVQDLKQSLKKRLGLVFQEILKKEEWNSQTEESYLEEVSTTNFGINYRDMDITDIEKIDKSMIDEESLNYFNFKKSEDLKNTKYTDDGKRIVGEEGATDEEYLKVLNHNIWQTTEDIKALELEIGEYQQTLDKAYAGEEEWTKSWTEEDFEKHKQIMSNKRSELTEKEKSLKELKKEKENFLKEHPELESENKRQEQEYNL